LTKALRAFEKALGKRDAAMVEREQGRPPRAAKEPARETAERPLEHALRWAGEGSDTGARPRVARRSDPGEPREFMGLAEPNQDRWREPRALVSPRRLALAQGLYYAATGVWSLVDIRSFQRVTGPKTDLWLVKTVGVLVTVVGSVLTQAAIRGAVSPEVKALALGSAVALGSVDVIYTTKGRISPVYLLDALLEAALAGGWLGARRRAAGPPRRAGV
jgi:hypothetical protein